MIRNSIPQNRRWHPVASSPRSDLPIGDSAGRLLPGKTRPVHPGCTAIGWGLVRNPQLPEPPNPIPGQRSRGNGVMNPSFSGQFSQTVTGSHPDMAAPIGIEGFSQAVDPVAGKLAPALGMGPLALVEPPEPLVLGSVPLAAFVVAQHCPDEAGYGSGRKWQRAPSPTIEDCHPILHTTPEMVMGILIHPEDRRFWEDFTGGE